LLEAKKKWALKPEKTSPDVETTLVRLLEELPDLVIVSRKPAAVAYTTWRGGQIVTPLMINGQAARFVLDTDMNMSVISEAGAKRLGMRVSANEVAFAGVTGSSAPGGHTAVAGRLKVGGTEFRNVPFLVVPDSTGKLMEYPVEERGILDLPVMLAIQIFKWNREHRLELGFNSPGGRRVANLCFDDTDPLVEGTVESRRVAFVLDTGSAHSAAWPVFVKEFPALLQEARKGSQELIGLSGTGQVDAAVMPELRMMVAKHPERSAPCACAPRDDSWGEQLALRHDWDGPPKSGRGSDPRCQGHDVAHEVTPRYTTVVRFDLLESEIASASPESVVTHKYP
jgi:hypothetical protein